MSANLYLGFLENVRERTISGWVIDRTSPNRRVALYCRVNGDLIGGAIADRYRPDLAATALGDGYAGFELVVPESVTHVESVSATVAESLREIPPLEQGV